MIELFAHPFSSYCWKAEIALYENATPFDLRMVEDAGVMAELERLWPLRRFPVLREGARVVPEATGIIEYLAVHHPGPVALIPAAADAGIEVRLWDRFFDNYVMTPQGAIVSNAMRKPDARDPVGDDRARDLLDTVYAVLDDRMATREWVAGDFSMADCAAAPSLFYADWTHPLGDRFPHVAAYRRRLLARPSVARAVDEARPYRHYFPLGARPRLTDQANAGAWRSC